MTIPQQGLASEFTGRIIQVDRRTVGDVSYMSKLYSHPSHSERKVVVTEFYQVDLDEEEKKLGCSAHYWVVGEAIKQKEEIEANSLENRITSLARINPDILRLLREMPRVDGKFTCLEYTDAFSNLIRSEMLMKGMLG